jgi:uncharacterized iron-regulated membrane protein
MKARGLVLRLHILVGGLTGGLLLLLSVSGALLVFRSEIDDTLHGSPAPGAPGGAPVALQALLDAARRRHPTFEVTGLALPDDSRRAARVGMTDPSGGELEVLIDPHTGAVLASHWAARSPLHALRVLHTELYLGPRGAGVVGALGLWLLLQGTTGLYLWRPFLRRPAWGFTVRWRRRLPVVTYDLHKTLGAASLAFNIPIALTGALLGFAALAGPAAWGVRTPPASTAPPGLGPLSLDTIARQADRALPAGRLVSVDLRRAHEGVVAVRKRLPGDLDPRGGSAVWIDRSGGQVLGVHDVRRARVGERLWSLVTTVHYGDFAGMPSKALYLAGGLASAALVLTGYATWLTRPRSRASQGAGERLPALSGDGAGRPMS